jgi:hypothetical protein
VDGRSRERFSNNTTLQALALQLELKVLTVAASGNGNERLIAEPSAKRTRFAGHPTKSAF